MKSRIKWWKNATSKTLESKHVFIEEKLIFSLMRIKNHIINTFSFTVKVQKSQNISNSTGSPKRLFICTSTGLIWSNQNEMLQYSMNTYQMYNTTKCPHQLFKAKSWELNLQLCMHFIRRADKINMNNTKSFKYISFVHIAATAVGKRKRNAVRRRSLRRLYAFCFSLNCVFLRCSHCAHTNTQCFACTYKGTYATQFFLFLFS